MSDEKSEEKGALGLGILDGGVLERVGEHVDRFTLPTTVSSQSVRRLRRLVRKTGKSAGAVFEEALLELEKSLEEKAKPQAAPKECPPPAPAPAPAPRAEEAAKTAPTLEKAAPGPATDKAAPAPSPAQKE